MLQRRLNSQDDKVTAQSKCRCRNHIPQGNFEPYVHILSIILKTKIVAVTNLHTAETLICSIESLHLPGPGGHKLEEQFKYKLTANLQFNILM